MRNDPTLQDIHSLAYDCMETGDWEEQELKDEFQKGIDNWKEDQEAERAQA